MRTMVLATSLVALLLNTGVGSAVGPPVVPVGRQGLLAGVGVVDATWHVGASAGQYASAQDTDPGTTGDPVRSEWDPNLQHVKNASSYGIASRLSIRAIVLQSPGEAPVALVKDDNYLSQDLLVRRAAQLLAAAGSQVTYDHLLVSASHDHNSPYYATPSAAVWLFQDVVDLRMFEYQARQIASAVQTAERSMRPARLGATTVQYSGLQGNIAGSGVNEDGSPVGYPLQENDHGLVVLRIDDLTAPTHPQPLATYVNYAEHGESLDGTDLVSADWIGPFQRYVDRATGVPVVFSQGAVGSAEGPYEDAYPHGRVPVLLDGGEPVYGVFGHMGFAQAERGAHLLADRVIEAWKAIGGRPGSSPVTVPTSGNPVVRMLTHWIPGPVSHPYPSVSNCRTSRTVDGDPGAPALGLPDCQRSSGVAGQQAPTPALYASLVATGLPLPASYDAASFGALEENARLKLQVVRLGDVLLASCACEPQSDLIKALETRTDDRQGNRWDGFDYADPAAVRDAWPTVQPPVLACHPVVGGQDCPDPRDVLGQRRLLVSQPAFDHMQAQLHNPADGWDSVGNAATANNEPASLPAIRGNFTGRELPARCGYRLPVGLGHTGDYNGYTVSYREYQARDSYRKALTAYGPHTADYMVTRLMAMASALRCGTPIPGEPGDPAAQADEQRQQGEAIALGQVSSYYYDGWSAQLPDSAGPAVPVTQPQDVQRFSAATFGWVGGDNWTDDPTVVVQRRDAAGAWRPYGNQDGEVQTVLDQPAGIVSSATDNRSGKQRWTWTASFEAFDAEPRVDVPGGQVPDGTYRFVVDGQIHQAGRPVAYRLLSVPFTVSPWTGVTATGLTAEPDGSTRLPAAAVSYPRTYRSPIRFIRDDLGGQDPLPATGSVLCKSCTFRPWATRGELVSVTVTVLGSGGSAVRTVVAERVGSHWEAATHLEQGESVTIAPGGLRDSFGEVNSAPIGPVAAAL